MRSLIAIAAIVLANCSEDDGRQVSAFDEIEDESSLSIQLYRGRCLTDCPDYYLTIKGDGTVEYCGIGFVEHKGPREGSISTASVRALFDQIIASGFLDMQDEYIARITDHPTYIVKVSYDDVSKSLTDYVGVRVDMPEVVTELEDAIDQVSGAEKWIGLDENRSEYNRELFPCPDPKIL